MSVYLRKRLIIGSLLLLLVAAGVWYYAQRREKVDLATYVPESALAYLEINDWPEAVNNLIETRGWKEIVSPYKIDEKVKAMGRMSWLASLTGAGETAILARAQFAFVITGIEAREEAIRPRWAMIVVAPGSAEKLGEGLGDRLETFARKVYGRTKKETIEQSGIEITVFKPDDGGANPERGIYSAALEGEWILANHPDAMRACIDTRQGKAPSMKNNFYIETARPLVRGDGNIFGFMTGEGLARMMRFSAFVLSAGPLRETGVLDVLQDVFSDLAIRTSDGIAYGTNFDDGLVVDRYCFLLKPEMAEKLAPLIKIAGSESRSVGIIPPQAGNVTVIRIEDPGGTLDRVEDLISSRIGTGQSFLLHQFMLGAREAILGTEAANSSRPIIGDEIASFTLPDIPQETLWLIATRDRAKTLEITRRYLTREGGKLQTATHSGTEILTTDIPRSGAAAMTGDFLALGDRRMLVSLIDAQKLGQSLSVTSQFKAAGKPSINGALIGYSSVKSESAEMMASLAGLFGGTFDEQASRAALEKLPLAASATSFNEKGMFVESRSPFGNFPLIISILYGASDDGR